ncbi:MAG: glycosyltransferase family 39 protein, partial [Nitrospirales bacterium]|nr:glycosyltransferase family 39 protein [Nitrospirales bacterium]
MKRLFLPLIIVILCVSFFRLGSVTLFDVDEAVFAQATKEMVQSNDWITPTYNGAVRYDKPILIYWLMGASYMLFGVNETGARFPSAAAGAVLAVSLFFFCRRYFSEKAAFIVAFALVLSPYFFVYTHASVTDMTLTLFITLSLLSFYHWHQSRRSPVPLMGFYLFSALAFLTKGLIGILFPFGTALIYLSLTRGIRSTAGVFSPWGILLFLSVSGPWYFAQWAINGQEFIDQFFIKHHFKRFSEMNSGHAGPVYFYLITLLAGLFPWIAFFPLGIREAIRNRAKRDASADLALFSLIWFGLVVTFFTISTTKLPNYILPSIPAAVILITGGIVVRDERWRKYALVFIAVVAAILGCGALVSLGYLEKAGISPEGWVPALAVLFFLFSVVAIASVLKKRIFFPAFAVVAALFLCLLSLKALPVANNALQGTLHKYSILAKARLYAGDK